MHRMYITLFQPLVRYRNIKGWRTWTRLVGFVVPLIVVSVLCGSSPSNWLFVSHYYPWTWSSVYYPPSSANISIAPAEEGLEFRPGVAGDGEREADPHVPNENKTEEVIITTKGSNIYAGFNDTRPKTINICYSNMQILEAKLQQSRAAIRDAKPRNRTFDPDYVPTGPIYRNPSAFHRSYLEMERLFKVFIYEEGKHPIFHNGPCKGVYSMEGNFIYMLEMSCFRTNNPDKATVYFLPFSVASMVHFIYDIKDPYNRKPMMNTVKDYVNLVVGRYPYWNRSTGSDHFMLSCHDWGPKLSTSVPELFKNSIRALCNANTSEGFQPSKDVSIPEINLPGGRTDGLIGGPSPSKRPILAFFAGRLHGPIRPILLQHWKNNDPEIQVFLSLPKNVTYYGMMRKSKYCICPSGYEVASPRMAETLYTGCVPVIIKEGYVPLFSDFLNWKKFSVEVPVKDIPKLKEILAGIPARRYIKMQRRGVAARRHFEVNFPPKRYDVFHMIIHSIWLRRLNVRLRGVADS